MNKIYKLLLNALNSWVSIIFIILYCIASFFYGQKLNDMSLFSASGSIMTIFGLFSMIKFTTIEKFINQEQIASSSTGITGPPISQEEATKLREENIKKARIRLKKELRTEIKGILFTVLGTLISAYGTYIPVFLK